MRGPCVYRQRALLHDEMILYLDLAARAPLRLRASGVVVQYLRAAEAASDVVQQ